MFSPVATKTISPRTIAFASIFYYLLFLTTNAVGGMKFSNYAIISADLDVYAYEKAAVKMTIAISTIPR
jgi:hypothetical protein